MRSFTLHRQFLGLVLATVATCSVAQNPARNGLTVTVPNGYAHVTMDDMQVRSTAGTVRWTRVWDGKEWKFNPHWESLSHSWKNMTGSQTADTTGGTVTAGTGGTTSSTLTSSGSSCWVSVDEDWTPSAGPMLPERTTPFNRLIGEAGIDYAPPVRVSVDYAGLCVGTALPSGVAELEGIRRQNELYLGDSGRYAFSNRAILEKRAVRLIVPAAAATLEAQLANGSIALSPVTNDKGYRWIEKSGDWIDYNTQGQVVAYGDRNDNTVWLARDTSGRVRGVVDGNGRVVYTLHYTANLLTEVRDYPIAGNVLDLPARKVTYDYDSANRLTQVTDVRGYTIKYDYNAANQISKITDQELREETLAYTDEAVTKRTAPDLGVTDYVFEYDDVNKQFVSKITGPQTQAGRRVENIAHNRVGKLVRKVVNGRTDVEVRYDTGARAELRTNARGFTTRITRNEFDQIVQIDQPDGTTVKRSYSAVHLQLTETTDEEGFRTLYQYDSKGNLLKKTEAAGTSDERITEYQVNSRGQTTTVTRKGRTEVNGTITPDAVLIIEYDALGQIEKIIDAENHVHQYVFNRAGNLARYSDPRTHATHYEVDAAGNLTKVTNALNHAKGYGYDKVGNLVTYTDARLKETQLAYDAMNRREKIINPVLGQYKILHNAQGLPIEKTDEDGRRTEIDFDNFLRLTRYVDNAGNTTELGYQIPDGSTSGTLGSLNGPTRITYPTFVQNLRYDELERPTSQAIDNPNALGLQNLRSSVTYDKRGNLKTEMDTYQKSGTYTHNALGHRTEFIDRLQYRTKAQYDARGNLLQLTDAENNTHQFAYDRNDRLLRETRPVGQTMRYQYDAAGNLEQRIDANNNKAVYTFDEANRLRKIRLYKPGDVLVRTIDYTWDTESNLTDWSDTDATRPMGQQTSSGTAVFDDAGRKTSETVTYPGGYSLSYGYGYSLAGKKTRLTWADGTETTYGYSANGELESVTIPNEGSINVNQFKWLAPAKVTLPGGGTQEKTYDGLLKLESIKAKTPGQQTVLDISNSYGKELELKQSNRTDTVGNASTTRASSYTYDDEVRLTRAVVDTGGLFGTDTETFTLDGVANRKLHSKVSGAWQYDANNRLIQRGTGSDATLHDYDDAGNLIEKTGPGNRVTRYGYDVMHRLIEVKDGADNVVARYGYDPRHRRIWKEQYRDGQGNALPQARRTYYLYADEGLIAEATQDIVLNGDQTVTPSGQPHITAQYGPHPDVLFTTGMLFIKTTNSNNEETLAYYHHDHLGTAMQATDRAGNVVWGATYNAFGQASTNPSGNLDIQSNLRFPGQIYDAETGLHYNWHRYYDPTTGRYLTSDPIGLDGGINTYVYVEGSPTIYVDATGLWCVSQKVADAIAGGFGGAVGGGLGGGGWIGAIAGGALGTAAGYFGSGQPPFLNAISGAAAGMGGGLGRGAPGAFGGIVGGAMSSGLAGGASGSLPNASGGLLGGAAGGLLEGVMTRPPSYGRNNMLPITGALKGGLGGLAGGLVQDGMTSALKPHICKDPDVCFMR